MIDNNEIIVKNEEKEKEDRKSIVIALMTVLGLLLLIIGIVFVIVGFSKQKKDTGDTNADLFIERMEGYSTNTAADLKSAFLYSSMDLYIEGSIETNIDIYHLTQYDNVSCDVSDKDMAALEERGFSATDMEDYYLRYDFSDRYSSPRTGNFSWEVIGLYSIFKGLEQIFNSNQLYLDEEWRIADDASTCDSETELYCTDTCESVIYPKALEIGIIPLGEDDYDLSYVTFANKTAVTTDDSDGVTFTCDNSVSAVPVNLLSVYVLDVTSPCFVYQNYFGGDFGEAVAAEKTFNFKLTGWILMIVGALSFLGAYIMYRFVDSPVDDSQNDTEEAASNSEENQVSNGRRWWKTDKDTSRA
ncbi:hypothetical protein ADUPG1_013083 [Aduncisulcus paluster]|uniref:Uncharacterized protein n=1 Tax=Aduncisulcus paluster TaxID=2918883 RepID=A0ABQ5K1Q0_9EUKA|nr:hypothetical protein ADUPG1_013083 [Aduncisulcus paluster]